MALRLWTWSGPPANCGFGMIPRIASVFERTSAMTYSSQDASIWTPDGFIHHLYVDPEFIGGGIGTLLLDATIRRLSKPVVLKCLRLKEHKGHA
ncbi:MAG: GNAT family N-acetyltransferase [Pseudomonadales bacterium]